VVKAASEPVVVRSAFDLPEAQRSSLQKALNETFAAAIEVRFETSPELVSGIELTVSGQKIAWSIADYLASLEQGVEEILKAKDKPDAKSEPKPKPKPKPAMKRKTRSVSKPKVPKLKAKHP
jgi:F-type H+-transporting ATPase subunit b